MTALWLTVLAAVLALPGRVELRPRPGSPNSSVVGSDAAPSGAAIAVYESTSETKSGAAAVDRRGASPRAYERPGVALIVAILAVAGACVALVGPVRGAVAAAVLAPIAAIGLRALQRRTPLVSADRAVALTLDLAAAALRSGRPLADALALAAPAAGAGVEQTLTRVAGLLRLGADAEQAWSAVPRDGPLAPVAVAAVRSAASGVRLAGAFERLAAEIRAETSARAMARAHRAGITAMAPLGACFLPAFVCLGVVPVVVGIARSALGVLP